MRLPGKCFIWPFVLLSVFPVDSASAPSEFRFSDVVFESYDRVYPESARRDYDGNVFIYFYKKDAPVPV